MCSDIGAVVCDRNRRYREVLLAARHVSSELADVRHGQGIARPCVLTFSCSCVSLQFMDWCLLHYHGMDLEMSSHTFTYTSQVPAQVLNHVVVSICFASGPSSIFLCFSTQIQEVFPGGSLGRQSHLALGVLVTAACRSWYELHFALDAVFVWMWT